MTCPNCEELARKLKEAEAACVAYRMAIDDAASSPGIDWLAEQCRLGEVLDKERVGAPAAAILARLADDDLAERVAGRYSGDRHCDSIGGCRSEGIDDYRAAVREAAK
jgi:hypothetical protein